MRDINDIISGGGMVFKKGKDESAGERKIKLGRV